MKPIRPRFSIERLEDRCNPSQFGLPWPDGSHLTLSFVPDGTATPNGLSRLYQTLSPVAPAQSWQNEILRAYQSWLAPANIDISIVEDSGQPLGTTGAVQGDARFGDIRIAAAPFGGSDEIAIGSPFSWTGTTLSGDLILNSEKLFEIGTASPLAFDIYSVAVHEAGHSLGLDHSSVPNSVLNESYHDVTQLGAGDVANVHKLYGLRTADAFDAVSPNNTSATAAWIPTYGLTQLRAQGDLTTPADLDFYKFNIGIVGSLTPVVVRLQASDSSLLTAKLTVLNSSGSVVASKTALSPHGNDLAIQFSPSLLGGTYTVKVEKADDTFSVGSYTLTVDRGLLATVLPIVNGVVSVLDAGTNDLLSNATALISSDPSGQSNRFDFYYEGSIETPSDRDSYRITVPPSPTGDATNLYAMAWARDANGVNPRIRVFDAAQQPVAFLLLTNEAGLMSVSVPNVQPGGAYYIQTASQGTGSGQTGRYALAIDINASTAPEYESLAFGTVNPDSIRKVSLNIEESGLVQFSLGSSVAGAGFLTLTVCDAAGALVFTLNGTSESLARTNSLFLAAGQYTLAITTSDTSTPRNYDLRMMKLSEPVGTYKPNSAAPSSEQTSPKPAETAAQTPPARPPRTKVDDAYYF